MVQLSPARLGTYGERATTAAQRQFGRSQRHGVLKPVQRSLTHAVSSRLCFTAKGVMVRVSVGPSFVAHVGGVLHCGSPWSCPICAPVVRERRAGEIDEGVSFALEQGWAGGFFTFTGPHHLGERLAPLLGLVGRSLHACTKGRAWKSLADSLGYLGSIRAVEVLWGVNGWHPHSHACVLFREAMGNDALEAVRLHFFGAWQRELSRHGFGALHEVHGVDARPVFQAGGLAKYLTKVEGGWGVGLELARSDVKRGKGQTPIELLRRVAEDGDAEAAGRWREYEVATYGKRAIVWSRGLRALLLPGQEELSDEEAAAAEGEDLQMVTIEIPGERWNFYVRQGLVGELLSVIEDHVAAGNSWSGLAEFGGVLEEVWRGGAE